MNDKEQKPTIEMCEFYDVWRHPHIHDMWHPICRKRRYWMVGVKCHAKREDCSDYYPSKKEETE